MKIFAETVDVQEFTHWFMEIGLTYLDKPQYSRSVDLEAPSEEDVQQMFNHVDGDRSGTVDLMEVQEVLRHLWPFMDSTGFRRGFTAADLDNSGYVDLTEFRHLIAFIVWLNERRHTASELEEAFTSGVGDEEFYFGCMRLSLHCDDTETRFLFEQECTRLHLISEGTTRSSADFDGVKMTFEQFITWAVRFACVTLKCEVEVESPAEARRRHIAFLSRELESVAGEYGDVHMLDLVSVMTAKKKEPSSPHVPAWKQAAMKAVCVASECSQLLAA
eukprot:COSAG02_NODE_13788_length_1347_cov_2.313278_1_plen_274_part_10